MCVRVLFSRFLPWLLGDFAFKLRQKGGPGFLFYTSTFPPVNRNQKLRRSTRTAVCAKSGKKRPNHKKMKRIQHAGFYRKDAAVYHSQAHTDLTGVEKEARKKLLRAVVGVDYGCSTPRPKERRYRTCITAMSISSRVCDVIAACWVSKAAAKVLARTHTYRATYCSLRGLSVCCPYR